MWEALYNLTGFLWGTPLMILMVGVGLYLTIRSGFFQILHLPTWWKHTIGEVFKKNSNENAGEGELKPYQALSTVLAGTVGSGNIAGVAAAIAIGGPGAVFWMWIIAIVGMMTKMTEVTLAVAYRKKSPSGEYYGGPMHYMKSGLGKLGPVLAGIYAVALFIDVLTDACFVQTNTLASCVKDVFNVPMILCGIIVVGISIIVILSGGIKVIGDFCGKIVPPMIIIYIIGCLVVICSNASAIPHAFGMIFQYAFSPAPAVGGFAGSTISLSMARGASRGIFSNEAGMGTATTVHATAQTDNPAHQGMYGILEVFIDTIIICTLTSLTVLCSGVWSCGDSGVVLTFDAFRSTWGQIGIIILCIAVVLFTYSSYIGFFVEFRTCVEFLFSEKSVKYLQWLFFALPILSVTLEVEQIWDLADMAVGFIVIPNMIALLLLSPKFLEIFKGYTAKLKAKNKPEADEQ
ncbi:sodium:alanine symporter family protein [Caproiciproducens sp. NJN-50]|uniref:alanine/glycine:cation symporter family protein n=1 Tax=Caproiciproducens sp. NJN-50 TaxID=2507162 RepID=UPI000FFE26CF|nr:sodium:alanine symporter family protein [Caproiciproducens sp. NJN-50]QAT48684.1 sodium:alanine symporter family protein [Caproiciproducens sp. NJN-50]